MLTSVDGAEVFRLVRRRAGLSQRELAARSGVALSTVSSVESGRHAPSVAVLQAVLDVAGLELTVDVRLPDLDEVQLAYLRHSLVRRLHRALGGNGLPRSLPVPARWSQVGALMRVGEVHLHGELAVRLWLPSTEPVEIAEVCVELRRGAQLPDTPDLAALPACTGQARAPVVIALPPWRVLADPPAALALDPSLAAHRAPLRAVARVLHVEAARDEVGRRVRAHRDPDHRAEREHVFHTKRFGQRPMPDATDLRSWRLGDDASLAEWLRRYGYPA